MVSVRPVKLIRRTDTIASQHREVEELAAIVGVQAAQREREEAPYLVEGPEHAVVAVAQERQALSPPRGDIGEHKGREVGALRPRAAVRHQVGLHEAGTDIVPLGEGADGDLVLEQVPALVVPMPRGRARSRSGRSSRSAVAGLKVSSCVRTSGLSARWP